MTKEQQRLATDIVGSFLPPEGLIEAQAHYASGVIDKDHMIQAENEAITRLVDKELEAGLEEVTSGEFRRKHWANDFWFGLDGISCERVDSGRIYQAIDAATDNLRISGRIGFNPNHPFFDDFSFLSDVVAGRAKCRQTLPSPANLLLEVYNVTDGHPEEVYPSTEQLIADISEAYRGNIMHLHELGCYSVQLDDTACGLMCEDNYIKRLLQGGVDLIGLQRQIIRVINSSLKGMPEKMETSIYLSGGDKIVPEWEFIKYPDNIMPDVLSTLKVGKFFLPFSTDNDYDLEVLRHVPAGKKVVLGLIDAHTPFPDDTNSLYHTVRLAEQYIPAGNLSVSPRTGFKLTTFESRGLTYECQWQKLTRMQKAFRLA